MPLSRPALATLALLAFLTNWNDFLWPLVVTNSVSTRPLTVGLAIALRAQQRSTPNDTPGITCCGSSSGWSRGNRNPVYEMARTISANVPVASTDASWLLWIETWGETRRLYLANMVIVDDLRYNDEPVFENLRVNIPLHTGRSFRLQLEHGDAARSAVSGACVVQELDDYCRQQVKC